MSRLMIVAVVLLAIVTALTLAAFKLFGWWAVLVIPVVAVLFFKFVAGRLIKRLFLMPFKAKGAVLAGARADVHAITPTSRPVPRLEEGEEEEEIDPATAAHPHYLVEVTVTPAAAAEGGFGMWEPGELRLIGEGRTVDVDDDEDDSDEADVVAVEIHQDGAWQRDEGMKYPGPQRLRLTARVAPNVTGLKFQYYFETFGQVRLPRVISGTAVPLAS